jgi:hypothetical protein
MRVAKRVPKDDVRRFDGTILFGPFEQTVTARTLVGEIASPISFVITIWSHPYVVIDEAGSLSPPENTARRWRLIG